jgi:hypothetical protein
MVSDIPEEIWGADLVLVEGKIFTVDESDRVFEAVSVRDGKIQAVGSNDLIMSLVGEETEVINLDGMIVLPGFVDSHEHCIRRGLQFDWVDCSSPPMESIEDIVQALKEKSEEKQPGEWVIGTWFDETKLGERRFPTKEDLDRASMENPIYLGRAGGHNAVANSMALKIAGISGDTPQPHGGHIEKGDGEPTGRLDELAAMNMVRKTIPDPEPEEAIDYMIENWPTIEGMLLSWGITTVHEAHIKAPEALAYQKILRDGNLRMRVGLMLDGMHPYDGYATSDLSRQGLTTGFGWGDRLYIIGVKVGVDGAMGSLTAALTEPYANDPDNKGIIRIKEEELTEEIVRCHKAGLRTCTHAIGDWAIDVALDALDEAVKSKLWTKHRHRIEHAGYVRDDQLVRMKELSLAVSASIGFCYPIGDSHIDALGEQRLSGYYPMKSFKKHGIVAGGNSDGFGKNWALTGIYGCVTRLSSSGRPLGLDQSISAIDAIRAYTVNGAYLEGTEDMKGSIEPGKLADLVILDTDIVNGHPEEILKAKVVKTIVGGEVVYESDI